MKDTGGAPLSPDVVLSRRLKAGVFSPLNRRSLRAAALLCGGALFLTAGSGAAHHFFSGGAPEEPLIEFDFEGETSADTHVTDTLSVGVEIELEIEADGNFNLDQGTDEDESVLDPAARFFVSVEPNENVRLFSKVEVGHEVLLDDPEDEDADPSIVISEAWAAVRTPIPGQTVIVGRQDIEDRREWVADRSLDGVRVVQRVGETFAFEAMLARQELVSADLLRKHRDDRPNNYYLRAYWAPDDNTQLGLYALHRDPRRAQDDRLSFLGGQAYGEFAPGFEYWAEAAYVGGEARDGRDISGFGFDIGATYEFRDVPMRPALTAGVAFGTGDRGGDTDSAFRQSGMHDNNARFSGVTSFKYYGEVFDPELSNMAVFTAGVGVRPTKRSSVDLVYHHYVQHRRSDSLRDVAIDAEPTGRSRNLGDEFNLIIGIRDFDNVALEGVAGVFLPGGAFAEDDPAYHVGLQARVGF